MSSLYHVRRGGLKRNLFIVVMSETSAAAYWGTPVRHTIGDF